MAKKTPNPTDKHVGSRVRMRRMVVGISQEKLGDALGLTFQQVQKYEKGANRIGASRLWDIAAILQVPVGFFFEGLRTEAGEFKFNSADDPLAAFGATKLGLRLATAFTAIQDDKSRHDVIAIAEDFAVLTNKQFAQQQAA